MYGNRITITPKEAASMLGLSLTTMYELVHSDGFPCIRVGKKILINVEGLRKWVDEQSRMVV